MIIPMRVLGIPCLIEVPGESNDWDILDRRGRWAPWLERKLTKDGRADLSRRIGQAIQEERASWGPNWEVER